jgi:hypothetical protein
MTCPRQCPRQDSNLRHLFRRPALPVSRAVASTLPCPLRRLCGLPCLRWGMSSSHEPLHGRSEPRAGHGAVATGGSCCDPGFHSLSRLAAVVKWFAAGTSRCPKDTSAGRLNGRALRTGHVRRCRALSLRAQSRRDPIRQGMIRGSWAFMQEAKVRRSSFPVIRGGVEAGVPTHPPV